MDFLAEARRREQQQAAAALEGNAGRDPNKEALARKYATELGLSPDIVRADFPRAEQDVARERALAATKDAPATARFLGDPNKAAVASDDVDQLAGVEKALRPPVDWQVGTSVGGVDLLGFTRAKPPAAREQAPAGWSTPPSVSGVGRDTAARLLTGQGGGFAPRAGDSIKPLGQTPATLRTVLQGMLTWPQEAGMRLRGGLRAEAADAFEAVGVDAEAMRKSALQEVRGAQTVSEAATPRFETRLGGALYGGGQSLMTATLPALGVGVITRNPMAAAAVAGGQTQVTSYGKYRERGGTAGEAALGSVAEGAVEVITERLPLGFVTDKLGKEGVQQLIGGFLVRDAAGEQIATLAQDAIDTAVANPDKTWEEYWAERPGAAYDTFVASLVSAGAVGALGAALQGTQRDADNAQAAEQTGQFTDRLAALAEASKLRERDPASFQELVADAAAEGGYAQEVYVDRDAFNAAFSTPEGQALLAAMPETVRDAAEQAAVTGDAVKIPVDEFATYLAPSPVYAALKDHLKLDPAGMTRAAAADWIANEGDALRAEIETRLAEQQVEGEFATSRQVVIDDIRSQLDTTGRFTSDINDIYASFAGHSIAVQAARDGTTPEAFLKKHPFRVDAGDGAVLGASDTLEQGEALTRPPVEADGTVRLTHWGSKAGLKSLNPKKWGKNADILSRQERQMAEDDRLPGRVYFGIGVGREGGYVPEHGLGKHRYTSAVRAEDLYDYDADPLNLRNTRVIELLAEEGFDEKPDPDGPDYGYGDEAAVAYDRAIVEAGFKGFWTGEQGSGLIGVMFEKPKVNYEGEDSYAQANDGPRGEAATLDDFKPENVKNLLDKTGWAVLTAANPAMTPQTDAENAAANTMLRADLDALGATYTDGNGKYGSEEPSIVVVNITKPQAQALGEKYRQDSVLTPEGLVYGSVNEKFGYGAVRPPKGITVFDTKPEDDYTEVPATGAYFSIDFGDFKDEDVVPGGAEDRISTRQPSTKRAQENALAEVLDVGTEPMARNAKVLSYNADLISEYPGFRSSAASPAGVIKDFVSFVEDNLLWLFDRVPAATRERARLWYVGGNKLANTWAEQYGVPPRAVAGVIAALSPQKDWYQNVSLAERILDIVSHASERRFDAPMRATAARIFSKPKFADALVAIEGKRLGEVEGRVERAMWVRIYDETYNPRGFRVVTPEGDFIGEASGNVAWGSNVEIGKALEVLRNPSRENISEQMGTKHKVRSFYNNIISPNAGSDVTIDTHAVAAGLLRPLSGGSAEVHHNFGSSPEKAKQPAGWRAAKSAADFGVEGVYGIYADAYRNAAKARGVLPREMQSITWEAVRGLFEAKAKRAKGAQSLTGKVDAAWREHQDEKVQIDDTRNQIEALAGGIQPPTWEGHGGGVSGEVRNTSYDGELAGRAVPRRPAGGVGDRGGDPAGAYAQAVDATPQTDSPAFRAWFGGSKVVDENGRPLVVYRGQHGTTGGLETRLPSLTFSDAAAASLYAEQPNNRAERAQAPAVYPVYLSIQNPIVNDKSDPYIDLSALEAALGRDAVVRVATKHARAIEQTGAWADGFEGEFADVADLVARAPERLGDLPVLAYEILDDPALVAELAAAGFDGAIHAGVGATFDSPEYRVFDAGQVKSAITTGSYAQEAPPFYSALRRAVETNPTKRASAAQWLATLSKTPGVKQEEIEWTGLREWLELAGGPVEREGVLAFLDDNAVVVEEVLQGSLSLNPNSRFIGNNTVRYAVENAGSREEMVDELTDLFDGRRERAEEVVADLLEGQQVPDRVSKFGNYALPGAEDTYKEMLFRFPNIEGPGTHWDLSSVGPHVRFTERRSPVAERVLFLDEFQNDWVAAGERSGFKGDVMPEAVAEAARRKQEATNDYFEKASAFVNAAAERLDEVAKSYDGVAAKEAEKLGTLREETVGFELARKHETLAAWLRATVKDTEAAGAVHTAYRTVIMRMASMDWVFSAGEGKGKETLTPLKQQAEAASLEMAEAEQAWANLKGGVNDVPFRKTWSTLAMKRMIRYAVDNGFTRVAWINGNQQNGGKTGGDGSWFYERNLVNTTNALLKKYGIKVEKIDMRPPVDREKITAERAPGEQARQEMLAEAVAEGDAAQIARAQQRLETYVEETQRQLEGGGTSPYLSAAADRIAAALSRGDTETAADIREEVEAETQRLLTPATALGIQNGFTITQELAEAATGGFPLFQENRGTFTPSTNTISLLRTANLSTFLHELGHWHLETLGRMASDPNAPADVKADFDAVLAWFGITGSTPVGYAAPGGEALAQPAASLTPAIRYKGKLYRAPRGGSHFDAAPLIPEADRPRAVLDGDNRVFVTETGKVLDRFKAIDYARLNGLIAADAPSWVATAPELASEYLAQDDTAPPVDTDLPAGRTALDVWNAMSLNQRRGYHEQFARGFEAYLFEGKAPTTRLRGVFQRFAAWLKAVYRDIARLDVELTDEVRGVMDRLVASSEEIALAEQSLAYAPLLENKLPGMTDDEWLDYQRLGVAATQGGMDELQTRALRDMKWLANARSRSLRKLQREGADKRAAVRAEVEAEVMAEPVNQARTFLTGAELNSDGTPADTGKLSLPAIKEIYEGNPSVDYAKLGYGKGGMLANVGIHPDVVAERFDFPSGDAMLRELLTAEPAAEKIEGLTDQRVLERYGDLSDPAEVEAAALNAIHNDLRLRVLAAEYNALAKATGKPKMLNDAARAYAREAVGRLAVKDLRQERYIAAERRAGRAAMKAMKAGDTELAASHKRAQIINAFAAQAVREAKETVDKGNNLFRRITRAKEDSTARTRNMDLVNVARAVLERYGVGTPRRAPGEYVQLLKEYDPDLYAAVEPMLVDAMLNARPLAELQFNDFSALRDLMSQLWTLSRRARQAQIDGKAVELTEISDKLVADLANRPASFAALGATRGVTDAERGKVNFLGVRALLRRVEEWAMLQGRSFESFVFRPISKAADLYRAANADAVAAWVAELEKIRGDMKPAKIAAPELGYTFGEGNGGVGLSELLGALRHTGNDSNLRKLLVGYNWGRIDENGELDTSRWDAFLARMHREGTLKKSHWDFIQAEWDLHETIKPQAQKAHRAVYGRYFDEVTSAPVTTPFGVYKGGYVAAAPDGLVGDDNATLRADAENLLGGGSALFPAPARGFTKRRTEEYATKMALDLRLVPRQIDKVLRFAYLAEPISDVVRILKEKQVAAGLKANDPTAMTDLLMPWLRRSATQMTALPPAGRGGAAVDKLARIMRQRTSMALLFANLSNTLQNITGLAPAALRTGKRNMLSATWRYLRDPSGSAASVDAASVFMANRADRQMEDMRLAIEEIVLNPSPYQKTQEFFARHAQFLQSALQNVLDRIAWMAAYDRATETGSPTPEADADSVVRTTMGSFSPEDLSRFETGPAWARPLTLFAGYFISQANLAGTEFAKASAAKNVGRGLEVWALGIAVPAIASMMIAQAFRGELGDEDEDGYLDDFLHLFFGGQASYLLAMVPVLGPTINAAILGFNDKPYDDKVSLSPVVSMAESSARVPAGAVKLAQGEGDWSRTIKDSAALATLATGIPFTLLGKPVSYAVDVMEGDIEPEGPVDATRGAITGTASPQSRE